MKKLLGILLLSCFLFGLAGLAVSGTVYADSTVTFHVPLNISNWPSGINTGVYVMLFYEDKQQKCGEGKTMVTPQNGSYNGTVTVQVQSVDSSGMGLLVAKYYVACIMFGDSPLIIDDTQSLAYLFDTSKPVVPWIVGDFKGQKFEPNIIHQFNIPKKLTGVLPVIQKIN